MKFMFDERKAAQAAAYILRINGGRMQSNKLNAMMYLANRQSLIERGHPITGGTMLSLDQGPVIGEVFILTENPTTRHRKAKEVTAK